MPKIYAPNQSYNGRIADVAFVDGVGDADEKSNRSAMAYFRRRGFGIGQRVKEEATAPRTEGAPNRRANVAAWQDFARSQGATDEELDGMTKDQIIERFGEVRADGTEIVDARDATTTVVGTSLRDAAVDPSPDDFLAPVNAGEADPHGPAVVSPEIHASGPAGIRPGEVYVDDVEKQDSAESDLAESVLIEQEEHPTMPTDDDGNVEASMGPLGLSDPGSVEMGQTGAMPARSSSKASWQAYAVAQGMDPAEADAASRADLIERYGSEES